MANHISEQINCSKSVLWFFGFFIVVTQATWALVARLAEIFRKVHQLECQPTDHVSFTDRLTFHSRLAPCLRTKGSLRAVTCSKGVFAQGVFVQDYYRHCTLLTVPRCNGIFLFWRSGVIWRHHRADGFKISALFRENTLVGRDFFKSPLSLQFYKSSPAYVF